MSGIFTLVENTSVDPNNRDQVQNTYKHIITSVTESLQYRSNTVTNKTVTNKTVTNNKLILDPVLQKTVLMIQTNPDFIQVPIQSQDNSLLLILSGSFNAHSERNYDQNLRTNCPSETIFNSYRKYSHDIPQMLRKLRGQFAFVLYDLITKHILVARDALGTIPLYIGYKHETNTNTKYRFVVSSQLKCLSQLTFVDQIKTFYPRSYIYAPIDTVSTSDIKSWVDFYELYNLLYPDPVKKHLEKDYQIITEKVRDLLYTSVYRMIVDLIRSGTEFGILLSGGLSSSLITTLVTNISADLSYNKPIRTFSTSINNYTHDFNAAQQVSQFLHTEHTHYTFPVGLGTNLIEKIIGTIETYDTNTVQDSIPMDFLLNSIRQDYPDIRVILTGDLSDHPFGTNLSRELSPNDFQTETINCVSNAHLLECTRTNKIAVSHGFTLRLPFSDYDYLSFILNLHPYWKRGKTYDREILRDAFGGYLPKSILYSTPYKFSQGISSTDDFDNNWCSIVSVYCNSLYSNLQFQSESQHYTYNKPTTKEQLFYRQIFRKLFKNKTSEFTVKNISDPCNSNNKSNHPTKSLSTNYQNVKNKITTRKQNEDLHETPPIPPHIPTPQQAHTQ